MVMQRTQVVRTADGVGISLDHYTGPDSTVAIIICPGFFQSKETATFRRMGEALAQRCDVVAMDFRGHGRSGGRYTFSAREGADLDAVLAWTQPHYQRLGILGFSMGGAIAMTTVRRHPGVVQSLLAVSAPAAFEDIEFQFWTPEAIRTGWTGWEAGAGCRPSHPWLPKVRPVEVVSGIEGVSLGFVHGTCDVIVGVEHSRRLFKAAREPKRLTIIEGGSHAEALFRDAPDAFLALLRAWWEETLIRDAT